MTHVVAIDFECAGGVPSVNGFTQLGAVLMRVSDSTKLAEFNRYASMQGYEWEKRCVDEFWSRPELTKRFKETKDETEACTSSPHQVIEEFWDWIGTVCAGLEDVYIITDNCGFDGGILKHFSKRDTLYAFGGMRDIIDVSAVYMGMSRLPVDSKLIDMSSKKLAIQALNSMQKEATPMPDFSDRVSHDHHPVNDAEVMALYWCFFQNEMKKLW